MHRRFRASKKEDKAEAVSGAETLAETSGQSVLRVYLGEVSKRLGALSPDEAQSVLEEGQQHLIASTQALEAQGNTPEAAYEKALAAFGTPSPIGDSFAATYLRTGPQKRSDLWTAVRCALLVVAPASVVFEITVIPLCWAEVNHRFDAQIIKVAIHAVVVTALLLLPLLMGWRIGMMVPRRAALGTFLALAFLFALAILGDVVLMFSGGSGAIAGIVFLGLIACYLYWIPGATLAAYAAERVSWRKVQKKYHLR